MGSETDCPNLQHLVHRRVGGKRVATVESCDVIRIDRAILGCWFPQLAKNVHAASLSCSLGRISLQRNIEVEQLLALGVAEPSKQNSRSY